jgi:hypothetical protein
VGALVNGIKAVVFGGIPGAMLGGLVLDKFLGVKQFRETLRDKDIGEVYSLTGGQVKLECETPTWLGRNIKTQMNFENGYDEYIVRCWWRLNEEWMLATLVLGITSAFWVYRYLSKNS